VGTHRAGPLLGGRRMKKQKAVLSPETVEGGDDVLEVHGISGRLLERPVATVWLAGWLRAAGTAGRPRKGPKTRRGLVLAPGSEAKR